MDPDEESDELRDDLVELNAALKKIDRDLDVSKIIEPLPVFVDVPPSEAWALLARMDRQVRRMQQVMARHQAPPASFSYVPEFRNTAPWIRPKPLQWLHRAVQL